MGREAAWRPATQGQLKTDKSIAMSIICSVERIDNNVPSLLSCTAPDQAPTWTDIFSALGTVGATVVALIFGLISLRLALRDHRARRQQDIERFEEKYAAEQRQIRSQAERVASWVEVRQEYPTHVVVIQNSSDQPIWEIEVHYPHLSEGKASFTVIPANGKKELPMQPAPGISEQAADLFFRDNAGRRWYRPAEAPGELHLRHGSTSGEDAHVSLSA